MSDISEVLRSAVILRAGNRCEYCHLAQAGQEATFHIDHIKPRATNGPTALENLALACVSCSLHKSARESHVDPMTGLKDGLFHPRNQKWNEHFRWNAAVLIGLTATGRATIDALRMNRPMILAIRNEERILGRHPA